MKVCTICGVEKSSKDFYSHNKYQWRRCRDCVSVATRKRSLAFRDSILTLLGNECTRCKITDRRVLQVDHIEGNGCKERRDIGQYAVYKRIFEHPEDYQLLCANCNWIKRFENGETPGRLLKEN